MALKKNTTLFFIFTQILTAYLIFPRQIFADSWYKGNTHTHTTVSDGSSSAQTVARHYKNLGYNFLFITDHNNFATYDTNWSWTSLTGSNYPLMINGVEMTNIVFHASGLGNRKPLHAQRSLISEIETVENDGAIAVLNHPYWSEYHSGYTRERFLNTVYEAIDATNLKHMEIANMLTNYVSQDEEIWDQILTSGRKIYGIASDDTHNLDRSSGKGWIMVFAPSLTRNNILNAIRSGNFYATTGVLLSDYGVNKETRTISITAVTGTARTKIVFTKENGTLLRDIRSRQGSYTFTGRELYVRAKITNMDTGKVAWTQPVYYSEVAPSPTQTNTPTSTRIPTATSTPTQTPVVGDANGDGRVDGLDYLIWLNHYGQSVAGNTNGDFNNDGVVDRLDYPIWIDHYLN